MTQQTIAVLGLGLMGGSLAMKATSFAKTVRVYDIDPAPLRAAADAGLVPATSIAEATHDAELVFIATPIAAMSQVARQVAESAMSGAIVLDIAGVKGAAIDAVRQALLPRPDLTYIPTNPMAGRELSGFEHATPHLFDGHRWVLCTLPDTADEPVSRAREFICRLGVDLAPEYEADIHDMIVAFVGNLPQLLVSAVVARLDPVQLDEALREAPGLRRNIRLAASPTEMWSEIVDLNRSNILYALDRLMVQWDEWRIDTVNVDESATIGTIKLMSSLLRRTAQSADGLAENEDRRLKGALSMAGTGFIDVVAGSDRIALPRARIEAVDTLGAALVDLRNIIVNDKLLRQTFERSQQVMAAVNLARVGRELDATAELQVRAS